MKPYPASITVNIADALRFLSNGYLKSSIHWVVAPPGDQAHLDRLGVLYFVGPEDELVLKAVESPVLERLGLGSESEGEGEGEGEVLEAGEWMKARVAKNVSQAGGLKENDGEQVILKGVKAK